MSVAQTGQISRCSILPGVSTRCLLSTTDLALLLTLNHKETIAARVADRLAVLPINLHLALDVKAVYAITLDSFRAASFRQR